MSWWYRTRFLFYCLMGICVIAFAVAHATSTENLMSLERMGAGVPAGWHISGSNYDWQPERNPGPLGIGAARIRFGEKGRLHIDSPARFMHRGVSHAAVIWLRSEPAGAVVRLALHDNDSNQTMSFSNRTTASETWQRILIQGVLPETAKDRYYLTVTASGQNCALWLDGLWLGECETSVDSEWQPAMHPSAVTLKPESPWGIVSGDSPLGVFARVVGVTRRDCHLRLRVVHTNGMTEELPTVALDDSGAWQGTLEVPGEVARFFGMLRLEAMVVGADGKPLSLMTETLLARVPDPVPGPRANSAFGIHVSLREPDLAAVAKLGYKWCRLHDASGITKWGYVEAEQGKWVWFDEQVSLAKKHGLCILGMLDGSPPWESGSPFSGYFSIYGAPRNIDNWRNYVRHVVGHYAGTIDDWEVWNEPWDMSPDRFFQGGSPQLYVELLKAAYQEAKNVNPDCTIMGIDTYPAFWDRAVLRLGALPYYDLLSWHRYDPGLHGYSNDAIARVASRLHAEQAAYGTPKSSICTEGGPDVSLFHGSFFSFADPVLSGDWSRGADQLARMYLSCIAAGVKRFFLYSVHNDKRYGKPIHMAVEPGFLLRPMHLTVAALAHFIEGASYATCLQPSHDISAHIFHQPGPRPYADAPSTVVVLIANGEEPEDLPKALPPGVRCFDRWGNPTSIPTQATRSPVYLVATEATELELLGVLRGSSSAEADRSAVNALLNDTVALLAHDHTSLWTLFSSQGSLAIKGGRSDFVIAQRDSLKADGGLAACFQLPADVRVIGRCVVESGELSIGWVELAGNDSRKWTIAFAAVPDGGVRGNWRYLSLTIIADVQEAESSSIRDVADVLKQLERAMVEGGVLRLRKHFRQEPFCGVLCALDGEKHVFTNSEYFIMMLHNAMQWGAPSESTMSCSKTSVCGNVATVFGEWKLVSPVFAASFGSKPFTFTATLLRSKETWKLASLCVY